MDTLFEKPIKSVADGKFICRNCYAIFGSLNELNNHIIPEHTLFYKPPIERMEENKYICQSCYNIPSSKEEFNDHIMAEHSKAMYTCKYCGLKAIAQQNMASHMEIVHEKVHRPYSCNRCDNKFNHKDNLTMHIQRVHNRAEFYCYQCKYKTKEMFKLARNINYIVNSL